MKKIYSILSMMLLLAAASCNREMVENAEPVPATKDRVPIIMSFAEPVTLQAQTKADDGKEMGLAPSIKTIHVAVFGSSGYLKDYASAIPCDEHGNPLSGFVSSNATTGYFKVYLPFDEGPSRRRIHVIANGPSALPFNSYEGEDAMITALTVSDGNGAYWTRFETDPSKGEGIMIKTTDTGSGIVRDTDANGDYVPADKTTEVFQGLKLIRNFAGITVVKDAGAASNFTIDAFAVCNMPSEGRIPIYNENSSEWIPGSIRNVASSGYSGLALDPAFHLTYNASYYPGFPATPTIDTHIPQTAGEFNAAGVSVAEGETIFVYERAVTDDTAPFVLIKAHYEESPAVATPSSPTYYYRLDITPGEHYVPLYRNFNYRVKISGINIPGYATPGEAAKRNSGDNFSISLDTQELSWVSNGTTQLFVQEMEVASLYSAGDKDFWYQFFLISDGKYYNGATGTPAAGASTSVTIEQIQTGALASWSRATDDDAENKRHITYTLNEATALTGDLTSVLRITGTYTPDGVTAIKLIRDVKFTVMAPKTITASFSPSTVGPYSGEQTSLNINLPGDLPKGLFPLTFMIEDSAKGLNATDKDVSVTPGPSIIDSDQSYQFIKTLNWSDYEDLVKEAAQSGKPNPVLSIGMKTTKDQTATTAWISSANFGKVSAALAIDTDNYISPGRMTANHNSTVLHVKVFSDADWLLSIGRENGTTMVGASLSDYSGSATPVGGQSVDVTIPENPGTTSRIIVLTLRNTSSGTERKAYINQSGKEFKLTAPQTSLKGNVTSTTLHLTSDYASDWTITAPAGVTVSPSSGTGNADITVTMGVNNSTTEDLRHLITATLASEGLESKLTIVQRKAKLANDMSVTFERATYAAGTNVARTINGITGTFSSISNCSSSTGIQVANNSTLHLAIDGSIVAITSVTFSNKRAPSSFGCTVTGDQTSLNTSTGEWHGNATDLTFKFNNSGSSSPQLNSFTVKYSGYLYE